jgi:hypothetical protein
VPRPNLGPNVSGEAGPSLESEGDTGSEDLGTGDAEGVGEGVGRLEVSFGETKADVGVEGVRVARWSKSAG